MLIDWMLYIDGGTGSMLLQAAIAGLLGVAVTMRTYWHAIVAKFRGGGSESGEKSSEDGA